MRIKKFLTVLSLILFIIIVVLIFYYCKDKNFNSVDYIKVIEGKNDKEFFGFNSEIPIIWQPEIIVKKIKLNSEIINEHGWHYIGKMHSPRVDSFVEHLPDGRILMAYGHGRNYHYPTTYSTTGPYAENSQGLSAIEIFDPKTFEITGFYYKDFVNINSNILASCMSPANIKYINNTEVVIQLFYNTSCTINLEIILTTKNGEVTIKYYSEEKDKYCNHSINERKQREYYFTKYRYNNKENYIYQPIAPQKRLYVLPNDNIKNDSNIIPFSENKIFFAGGTDEKGIIYDDIWIYTY